MSFFTISVDRCRVCSLKDHGLLKRYGGVRVSWVFEQKYGYEHCQTMSYIPFVDEYTTNFRYLQAIVLNISVMHVLALV